jgi:hypothetical protein
MSLERRIQRAARKRRAREDRRLVRNAPAGTVPPSMLADFFKGIALQLDRLEFHGLPGIGGTCIFKTLAAYQAARMGGVDVTIGFGGLIARVGPDPYRDVIAFCGPRHMGCIAPNGHTAFHCWLRYRDQEEWIFDASVGEWSTLDAVRIEQEAFGTALPPPQWTIALPDHWLKPAAELELSWRMEGTPPLGEAWYGPFYGDADIVMQRIRDVHEDVGQQIAAGLARICNAFAERHGYPNRFNGHIYPLRFWAMTVQP